MFKEQFSKMSAFRKRAFAVALSAAVVSTSFNVGAYAVEGGSSANGRVITAFEELPEDILYQNLPVGAKESDINFPKELNITLYSDTEEKTEEQPEDSGDIVIEEPEQENSAEEPAGQDGGEGSAPEAGAGESSSGEAVDTGAGNTETGAETGSTESGATEAGAGAGETAPAAEGSSEPTGETTGETAGAGEGNTESGTSEETTNDEGSGEQSEGGSSQESTQEESDSSESSGETAVDESAIQGIRSTAAAVIRAFKPVTVYAAENEDGGEKSEIGDSEDSGEQSEDGEDENSGEQIESGEDENKENEGDAQNEGGAENTDNSGNIEQPESNEGGEAAAPAEESGSSEDGNSDAGNNESENTEGNTDDGITELSDGEARVLRDVNWKLVRDESAYSKFQAVLEGDVFVYEPKISEYGLKSDVELPKIRVTIVAAEETVSEDTVSEDTVSEDTVSGNSPAFSQMMIVGGVRVTVEAPEGVFPEGAVLHVTKLEGEKLEKAESYVKEDMGVSGSSEDEDGEGEEGSNQNLQMVFFDVTITDAEGNEIQPNTEFGEATVKMANVDLVENYLEAQEGEDSEGDGKNAELKVYHFDENMESAETPEVQVDGSDKAMTVNVGHFSVVGGVLSAQSAATAIKDKWDDGSLYLEFSGGDFYVDTKTNGNLITVSVNKNSTANYAKIEVSGSTTRCLNIKPYNSDTPDVNVVLNNVNIKTNDGFYGALTLDQCNALVTLNNGTSTLENGDDAGYGIRLYNHASLVLDKEDDGDSRYCKLSLKGKKYAICGVESNSVIVEGGKIIATQVFNGVDLTANGGLIDMASDASTSVQNSVKIRLKAGTHSLPSKQFPSITFNGEGTHTIDYTNYSFEGGSIKINDLTGGGVYDKMRGRDGVYHYQYILNLSGNYQDKKLTGVFGKLINDKGVGGQTPDYNFERDYKTSDVYTDEDGKLYLWLDRVDDTSFGTPFSIEMEGETRFVRKRVKNKKLRDSLLLPYTKRVDSSLWERLDENEMIPYKPVTGISVNVGEMKAGNNYLIDFTTLYYDDGKQSISGANLSSGDNGLANQFWDIDWSLYQGDTIIDTNVNLPRIGQGSSPGNTANLILGSLNDNIYTLKAKMTDGYGVDINEPFTIKKNIYVTGTEVELSDGRTNSTERNYKRLTGLKIGKQYIFALSGNRAGRDNCYAFIVKPDNADHKDISLSLTESADIIKTDDSETKELRCTFLKAGTYKMTATITDGLGDGKNYEETIAVEVVDSTFGLKVKDWEWTGGSYAEVSSNFTFTGTPQTPQDQVTYGFYNLSDDIEFVSMNKSTGEYEINEDKIKTRTDISQLDINSYDFQPDKKLSEITDKPNAGVYLAKCKDKDTGEAVYYVFQIYKRDIGQNDINCKPHTGTYNGKTVSACSVSVVDSLKNQGIDVNNDFTYTLSKKNEKGAYEEVGTYGTIPDIINVGEYKLVVSLTGGDNYRGEVTVTPSIAKKSIKATTVKVGSIAKHYYTGLEIKPSGSEVIVTETEPEPDIELTEGVDYTLSYSNNIQPGSRATVTITAASDGNYTGSRDVYFTIERFNGTITLLYDGSKTLASSYDGPVQITTAENYLVSDNETGPFESNTYTMAGIGKISKVLYFFDEANNAVLPAKTVTVNINADMPVYFNGSKTQEDWYTGDVKLTTDDAYRISTSKSGTFGTSITVTKSGNVTLYFQDKYGNDIDISKTYTINIDKTAPTGKISAVSKSWSKFQGSQKTVAYTNEQKRVTLTGNDNDSKVKNIQYYITDTFYSGENKTESAAKGKWETYNSNSKPGLSENSINYIYAKVTDNAGNSFYMSSEGIWYDTKAPKVTTAKATPKDTTATVKVTATDTKGSGVKYVYVLVKKKDESKPTAKTVKSSGKRKELSEEDGKDDFEITGLTAKTGYVVYTVAEDFCENLSEVKETKITTKESSSSSSSGTGGKSGANGAAGAGGAGAGGSNSAKRGVSSDSAKNGKGGAGGSASENGGEGDSDKIRNKVPFIDDASEGVLTGREYTSGWEKIENETLAADAPAEIHIDMNGATVVPAKLLNDFANRDVTVYLEMGDGLVWAVNGLSFTSTPEKDIDFKVKKNTKNIPSKILTEVADVYPHTNLTLSHDGDFGFTAIMSLDMGADNSGMFGNLYYYNEDAGSLEFIDSQEIGGSGNVQFEFTHASDYTVIVRGDALTEKTAAALTVENSDSDMRDYSGSSRVSGAANVAKHSNHLWLLIISIISILLCGFILFMPDKKKWGK